MIAEVEGRKPRKKKPTPQTTIVYNTVLQFRSGIQCDDQLGNSSAQKHFDTTIPSVLSDNSSVAPICCGHPPEGKDESQTGKCSDDGRGPVKTLSGRLARKLQRSASLVNAGLSKQIQTVLDAATVDRCDFVEICCSDVPCLTEAMQRRGLYSFSLLRFDGVGNHDAQTREKNFGWLTEKRAQKAWLRCSLRSRQIFRQFFEYAAAVLRNGGHIYWEWPAKCIGWSSVELREFRTQQKSLFLRKKKKKTICWNVIVGNFSHLILVSESTWVYRVKEITNTCGNKHQKERENIHLQ